MAIKTERRVGVGLVRRLAAVRERHGVAEYHLVRRLGRALGYDVVRANYYSPIPDTAALPASTWDQPAAMPGVALDLTAQMDMLESELAEYVREFTPPDHPPGNSEGFYLRNPHYGPGDAELLYAMVRRHRPARVLELGSGYSTLVIARACARNAAEGQATEHRVVDPFPAAVLTALGDRIDVQTTSAVDVSLEQFAALDAGDILFIDTTHVLKPGSEVLYLLLNVLPSLRSGVIVHVHDVYRPFEYPRALLDVFGAYWQEHYLLQAFLAFNREFEVVCATHALSRLSADRLRRVVPSCGNGADPPSGFWMRRTAAGDRTA